jgi:hypothetical protein
LSLLCRKYTPLDKLVTELSKLSDFNATFLGIIYLRVILSFAEEVFLKGFTFSAHYRRGDVGKIDLMEFLGEVY